MRLARHSYTFAFLSLVALLCLVEIWIVKSVWFPRNADLLSLAITADLTLGIPFLYYMLLVRARQSPAITLAPIFIAAFILAHVILPSSSHIYLNRLEFLLPVVEGLAVVYGLLKARAVARHYRQVQPTTVYASDALEASLRHTFGSSRMIGLLMTELLIAYYVVGGWFRSFKNTNPINVPISCHRTSGYGAVVCMFTGLLILETFGLHLVIQHWSPTAAWVLTALSIYSLLWIIGDYHAVRLHPIVLGTHTLYIRTGLRWRVDIDWMNIAAVRRTTGQKPAHRYLNAAVFGEPRFVLQLKEPVIAHGLFGSQKQVSYIGLTVDDDTLFQTELNKRQCD